MISEIFTNQMMNIDFESDPIELINNDFYDEKIENYSSSLAIYWTDAQGTLDAILEISVSLDSENWLTLESLKINKSTNSDDINIYLIDPYIKYLKIKYLKNNITNGKLTAVISIIGAK